MLAMLLCQEKSTLTNVICTLGQQNQDWSANYRLYSHNRVDESALFTCVLRQVQSALAPNDALVVALDDTLVRKTGTHIEGVNWRRDPLGPRFQTNLVLGQRYLQFSAAWPLGEGQARLVPIGLFHSPTPPKPSAKLTEDQLINYREEQKQRRLNHQAVLHMVQLRAQVNETHPDRQIIYAGDGSYTNAEVVKNLPAKCTYIGRIRKDAKLYYAPLTKTDSPKSQTGRPRRYGLQAPTPDALRQDEQTPWQSLEAFAAGKRHCFKVKVLSAVYWKKYGVDKSVNVLVIAPLGYRLRNGARLLYRLPSYLICTDPNLDLAQLLQYYLWRWGIEVNFREQKSLLGAGEAQVRTAASNQHIPAVVVAAYSLLWVAALNHYKKTAQLPLLPWPKWRKKIAASRKLPSTGDLIRLLRFELWSGSLRPASFYHFMHPNESTTKSQKLSITPTGALFSAA